jgi:hypothetical protein
MYISYMYLHILYISRYICIKRYELRNANTAYNLEQNEYVKQGAHRN